MDTLSESTSNKETDTRSALASAAGFMYQTLIFIDYCCQLNDEDTALYEKVEDITIISDSNKNISYIQIKQKAGSISLHCLIAEINRFWNYSKKYPFKKVTYTYQSTEKIRGERKRISLNSKVKNGIEIWQNLEQHQGYFKPLISYLQKHPETSKEIKEFLKINESSNMVIFRNLIEPFIIYTENADFEKIERNIYEKQLNQFIIKNQLQITSSRTLYDILSKKIEGYIQQSVKANKKSLKVPCAFFISLLNESYEQQISDAQNKIHGEEISQKSIPSLSQDSSSVEFDSYHLEEFQEFHNKMNNYIQDIKTAITQDYSLQFIIKKITKFISHLYKTQWNSSPEKLFSSRSYSSEHQDFFYFTNTFINKLKSFTKQELIEEFNRLIQQLNHIFETKGTLA